MEVCNQIKNISITLSFTLYLFKELFVIIFLQSLSLICIVCTFICNYLFIICLIFTLICIYFIEVLFKSIKLNIYLFLLYIYLKDYLFYFNTYFIFQFIFSLSTSSTINYIILISSVLILTLHLFGLNLFLQLFISSTINF